MSIPDLAEFLGEQRNDCLQIPDYPVGGKIENRRVRIIVYGNDTAGAFDSDDVLDRSRDSEAEI